MNLFIFFPIYKQKRNLVIFQEAKKALMGDGDDSFQKIDNDWGLIGAKEKKSASFRNVLLSSVYMVAGIIGTISYLLR